MKTTLSCLFLLMLSAPAFAAGEGGGIRIENARLPEMPPAAKTAAIYLDIVNSGAADRLLSAQAEATANQTELHATQFEGDMMRMRKVEAVDLAAGTTTALKPGGLHIMLIELKQPLRASQSVPLALRFEKAGTVQITVPVLKREGAAAAAAHAGHGQ
ncbi:MAG: copper chaperone PCu(A)C [Candidatus Competibacter denitrificans]